jgi:hypothetical protein
MTHCPFCDSDLGEERHVCPNAETIYVSREAYARILEIINNPPEPTEAMRRLLRERTTRQDVWVLHRSGGGARGR